MAVSLKGLNEKEIAELEASLLAHKRNKVDWTNMTDEERAWKNRTVEPSTPDRPTPQRPGDSGWYPRVLYGQVEGQVVGAEVKDDKDEKQLWAQYPDAQWDKSLLDHGIETNPSKPTGHVAAGWQHFGAGRRIEPPNPAIDVMNNPAPPAVVIPQMNIAATARTESIGDKIRAGKAKAKAAREASA